jgi:acetyl esterase/lipase
MKIRAKGKLLFLAIAFSLICLALAFYAGLRVQQYQRLVDDQPEVTLTPDAADISYCTMDGVTLTLDLYFPEDASAAPHQLLVYAHGGSFTGGDKRRGSGITDIPAMTGRGYAVAAVNYRLMPQHPFPAEIQDVKCAIRFLRAHAGEYNLLADQIGVWGGSAGGHLAVMLGLTGGDPAYEQGKYLDYPSKVDAVIDLYGPADLTAPMGWLQRWLLRRAFGTDDPKSSLLISASPVFQSPEAIPPFLIIHGEEDSAVPVEQSQALADFLRQHAADVTLVIVENANHNFKPTGGAISPTRAEISGQMADFFDRTLLNHPTK